MAASLTGSRSCAWLSPRRHASPAMPCHVGCCYFVLVRLGCPSYAAVLTAETQGCEQSAIKLAQATIAGHRKLQVRLLVALRTMRQGLVCQPAGLLPNQTRSAAHSTQGQWHFLVLRCPFLCRRFSSSGRPCSWTGAC